MRRDLFNFGPQHYGRIKAPKDQKRFDVALNFQRSGVSIIAVQIDAVGVEPDAASETVRIKNGEDRGSFMRYQTSSQAFNHHCFIKLLV
jgi:hypothetical protein